MIVEMMMMLTGAEVVRRPMLSNATALRTDVPAGAFVQGLAGDLARLDLFEGATAEDVLDEVSDAVLEVLS